MVVVLLGVASLVYLPGIAGPWVFDDHSNILQNSYLRIQSLDWSSLRHAAFSLESGPLQRPVSMVSFALNYYFAGSFSSTAPFKATNLALHITSALVVFWLLFLILRRVAELENGGPHTEPMGQTQLGLAVGGALLWAIHPIQVTSVLYVVQRMAELSALFTLAGLTCYLIGRRRATAGQTKGIWLAVFGPAVFGILGALSKESAVLLPLFILILELSLFRNEPPWTQWQRLPPRVRRAFVAGTILVTAAFLYWSVQYWSPRYTIRDYTMVERLMTETRVLFFYLSLMLVPRINSLGHIHDDIEISRSLVEPWTTLPSIVGIAAFFIAAIAIRQRQLLLSLGILWFLVAHLLESTILPLEIAHEHRNYLALLGVILALVHVLGRTVVKTGNLRLWIALPVIIVVYGSVTYQRASQWADYNSFFRYESLHHPDSARTQTGLGILLEAQGRHEEAMNAQRRAAELEPFDAGFMIQLHLLAARHGQTLGPADQAETLRRLEHGPSTAIMATALAHAGQCIPNKCRVLHRHMEEWLHVVLGRSPVPDASFVHYLHGRNLVVQGRYDEAIKAFRLSHELDRAFLHPLFEIAGYYLESGDLKNANIALEKLREANRATPFPRDREIAELAEQIQARAAGPQASRGVVR
jgi:tetratricopeptide (TPR) repeat protein